MDQATQATRPAAPTEALEAEPIRASYERARALADRLVDQVPALADTVEVRRELGTDTYGIRLHYGTGMAAGRCVLQTASIVEAEVTRDDVREGVVWIECRITVDGTPLIARALTDAAVADQLLAGDPEATQPIPTVGTSPSTISIPAITPVTLAAKADTEAGR